MKLKTTNPDRITHEKVKYLLRIADNALILGQRLSEWCGHGPVLEQDIALTNIALDLIGHARNWYQYIAEAEGVGHTEDDLAFRRVAREYFNVLLVEQPNGDFAHTIVRQFLFDQFHFQLLESLTASPDEAIAAIAAKSIKEVRYHRRFSAEWVIRLGDGTGESHRRMERALSDLWPYAGEMHRVDALDRRAHQVGLGPDLEALRPAYFTAVEEVLREATLSLPETAPYQFGGKQGLHSEHLDYLLAEMQFMQRTYPGLKW